ncbi:hypothetical protein MCOR25_007259 [Pyricularia grisea]|nr:hypothetical protein MCOR25_007259 [Pyricularia grisea]
MGLYNRALLGTKADSQTWDKESGRWVVSMTQDLGPKHSKRSITVKAQFVLFATEVFHMPKVSRLPGLGECIAAGKVKVIRTLGWDYKKMVGTQEVPAAAKWAKHLYVV